LRQPSIFRLKPDATRAQRRQPSNTDAPDSPRASAGQPSVLKYTEMISARVRSWCLASLLLTSAGVAHASQGPGTAPPAETKTIDPSGQITVRAFRVSTPPRVDAVLDDAVYQTLAPITGFVQQEPSEGQLATEQTLVWLLYDDKYLYVGARCRDSQPSRIIANDMRRDGRNVSANDNFSIIFDTFHDRRNGYEFLMNSIGGAWDTQITDERDVNRDWNVPWIPRSRQDAEGWTLEMAIPFRSLRYRGSGPQTWGINIRRNVRWKNELSYLSPVPRQYGPRGILRLSQAATLVGLDPPPAALNLDVKPYVVGTIKADRAAQEIFKNEYDGDIGFDAKYGLTQSLTADFTYRTDFAQVEDDDQQVNLTRFNLLFPEKREFFLEGQGMFAFGGASTTPPTGSTAPVNTPVLFFSRRIGLKGNRAIPIEAGGRLTGKAGRYSIGLLDIQTDSSDIAKEPSTNFGAIRIKRDILRRSYVGVIATRRSPAPDVTGDNHVLGLDANLSFFVNLNIVGYYAGTSTPGREGHDRSHRARFDYDADGFGLQVEQLAVGRNFNPETGFLRRAGFIENLAQVRVSRRPRASRSIRRVSYDSALDYITDEDRRLENRQFRVGLRTEMHSSDVWTLGYSRDFEFVAEPFEIASTPVPGGAYHASTFRAAYTLGTQRRISGDVTFAHGGFYGGNRTDLAYRGRAELTPRLSIEPGVSVNRVDMPTGRFTATILSARATLSFTPRMSTASLLQYNSTSSLFTTNVRFRWEYRPGSEIFLVYSDGRDTLERGFPSLTNRGFTAKLTRLFRF
jgi:hypothetical protein